MNDDDRPRRPRIGITAWPRTIDLATVKEPNETVPRAYVRAVARAGGLPMLLPILGPDDVPDVLDAVDGLVMAGGGDVDPTCYGEDTQPETTEVDRDRDIYEIALWDAVVARNTPALGICRGLQLLNVAMGGTLRQHVEGHRRVDHPVTLVAGGSRIDVNSLHHQSVARLGDGLTATAYAEDGTVEAFTVDRADAIEAVQWHPELLRHVPVHQALFERLVERAR